MRALMIILAVLYASPNTYASQEISTEVTSGRTLTGNYEGPPLLYRAKIAYSHSQIVKRTALKAEVSRFRYDYTKLELSDELGRLMALPQQSDEYQAGLGASYTTSDLTLAARFNQHLSLSPYFSRNVGLGLERSLRAERVRYGLDLGWGELQQPKSYFTDPASGRTRQRPGLLHPVTAQLYSEVIWSEFIKGYYSILWGSRPEDRPEHWGADLKHAYSLSTKTSVRLDLGVRDENRAQSLKDDRGYYRSTWAEGLCLWQPTWAWTVGAGVGAMVDEEVRPISQSTILRGVDSVLIKSQFEGRSWRASGDLRFSKTNRDQSGVEIKGGVAWTL